MLLAAVLLPVGAGFAAAPGWSAVSDAEADGQDCAAVLASVSAENASLADLRSHGALPVSLLRAGPDTP